MKYYKKKPIFIFILVIISIYTIVNSIDLNEISLHFISTHANEIEKFIENNFILSLLIYFIIYMFLLSLGLPLGAILAIVSGYFFTLSVGVTITLISAFFTSIFTFYLGKHFLYKYLRIQYGEKIKKVEKAVSKNGIYYVLAVRVSSILPFFWINLFFGAANTSYKQYVLPTLFGLIPGTIVYTNMGVSLSSLNSIEGIFSFKVLFSFLLLGTLIMLPVLIKKLYPNIGN